MTDVRVFNRNKSLFVWLIGIGFFLAYCGFDIILHLDLIRIHSIDWFVFQQGLYVLGFVMVCGGLIGLRSQTKYKTIRMALKGICIAEVVEICRTVLFFLLVFYGNIFTENIDHFRGIIADIIGVLYVVFWIFMIGSFAMIMQEFSQEEKLFYKIRVILNVLILIILLSYSSQLWRQIEEIRHSQFLDRVINIIGLIMNLYLWICLVQGFRMLAKDERIFPSNAGENEINANIRPRIITAPLIGAICCAVVFIGLSFLYIHCVAPIN